jgi:phage gp37-like protein
MYTIATIEDAIIAQLKDEISYLKTCDSIDEFQVDDVAELVIRSPAAYVVYKGGEYESLPGGVQDRVMVFLVIAVAKSARGGDAPRHGAGGDKGAYDMIEDVRAALSGERCGLAISALLPVLEECIGTGPDIAIYGIQFRTREEG